MGKLKEWAAKVKGWAAKVKGWAVNFWMNHVQKTIGTIVVVLASSDLIAYTLNYQSEVKALIGAKGYAGLRLALGLLVVTRAAQASRAKAAAAVAPK
jgi:hypothetical protein